MDYQLFDEWLSLTRERQISTFGIDPAMLDGPELAEYIRWNVLAAVHELHEFLDHIQWKPWSSRLGEIRDRDDAVEELVDVLHFVANLASAFGACDDEMNAVYTAKVKKNAARQETQYDSFGKAEGTYDDDHPSPPARVVLGDLTEAEEREQGRESVRHPATRRHPRGWTERWNTDTQQWETVT